MKILSKVSALNIVINTNNYLLFYVEIPQKLLEKGIKVTCKPCFNKGPFFVLRTTVIDIDVDFLIKLAKGKHDYKYFSYTSFNILILKLYHMVIG